jgi:hypothetical protein
LGRFQEEGYDLEIQYFSDLEGYKLDLTLRLLSSACRCPIYHPGEFQTIWRTHAARPYYWPYSGFQEGRTILGFLQFKEEASVFEIHTSGGGFHCLDLSLERVWQHQEVYIFRRAEPLVSIVFSRPYQQSSGPYQLLGG